MSGEMAVGATVLSALAEAFKNRPVTGASGCQPFSDPIAIQWKACESIRAEIEMTAKMKITGIVSNANMMQDTTMEHIQQGYDFVLRLAERSGLPVEFITVPDALKKTNDMTRFACPSADHKTTAGAPVAAS